jgi:hypothetical protein
VWPDSSLVRKWSKGKPKKRKNLTPFVPKTFGITYMYVFSTCGSTCKGWLFYIFL